MGVLGKARLVRRALLSDFCNNRYLEVNHKFSRQRIAIPDFVPNQEVFSIIKACLEEVKDMPLVESYIYSFFSNRIGQVFAKLYGRNCIADELIPWNVRQVITVSWADHTIVEEESGREVKFKKNKDSSTQRGADAHWNDSKSDGSGDGRKTADSRLTGGNERQGKPKKPYTLFQRAKRK